MNNSLWGSHNHLNPNNLNELPTQLNVSDYLTAWVILIGKTFFKLLMFFCDKEAVAPIRQSLSNWVNLQAYCWNSEWQEYNWLRDSCNYSRDSKNKQLLSFYKMILLIISLYIFTFSHYCTCVTISWLYFLRSTS